MPRWPDAISSRKVISRLKDEYNETLPRRTEKFLLETGKVQERKKKREPKNPEIGVIVEELTIASSACQMPSRSGDSIVGYITRRSFGSSRRLH